MAWLPSSAVHPRRASWPLRVVLAESPRLPRPVHHLHPRLPQPRPVLRLHRAGPHGGAPASARCRPEPDRGPLLASLANDGAALRANGSPPDRDVDRSRDAARPDRRASTSSRIRNWNDHASPFGFGPRRLVAPGMRVRGPAARSTWCVISHDHYDHLDMPTRSSAWRATHRPRFFVPLGVEGMAARSGRCATWWSSTGGSVTAIRGAHVRGHARPARLRARAGRPEPAPLVLVGRARPGPPLLLRGRHRLHAGDGGDRAAAAGPSTWPPFRSAATAPSTARHPNHVNPEEAVQLFEDVRGRLLVPMHCGTFALNREPHREPPQRLLAEALRRGLEEHMRPSQPRPVHRLVVRPLKRGHLRRAWSGLPATWPGHVSVAPSLGA